MHNALKLIGAISPFITLEITVCAVQNNEFLELIPLEEQLSMN